MKVTTKLKLHACSSFNCSNFDCDYCPQCSHAYYKGSAEIDGRLYEWEYNGYHGPLFECKAIGKTDWIPNYRHKVWDKFEEWYKRNFKHTESEA